MKANAPRRNLLVAMLYVLVIGSLTWIGHLVWSALGFVLEVATRLDPEIGSLVDLRAR